MAKRENSEFIDLSALWRQYRRNWYWFLVSMIVCGGLAFGYTKLRHQKYAVVANLLITPDSNSDITNPASTFASMFGSNGQVDDEIFIVSSHSLYYKVAEDLGLNISHVVRKNLLQKDFKFDKYPLSVRTATDICDTLNVSINFRVKVNEKGLANIRAKVEREVIGEAKDVKLPYTLALPYGEFTFFTTEYYDSSKDLTTDLIVNGYHAAAEMLSESIDTEIASKLSNVIQLRMETPYVDYGEAILNKVIQLYNERGIQESANLNELTAKFLDQRLDVIAHDLALAEKAIQDYKEANNIVDVKHETSYQSHRRASLDEELVRAQTAMNIIGMIHDFVADPAHANKMIPSLGLSEELAQGFSESLSKPIAAYNTLVTRRIELARSAKDGNRQLQILDEQIANQQAAVIASIEQARAEATRSMADLEKEMKKSQAYLSTVPNQEREFVELTRQNTVKQSLYLYLLQKREEVSMMIAKSIPKGQIIDQAYTMGEPLGSKKRVIWLAGLLFGAMVVPVWLYLRGLIRGRFESAADVDRTVKVPVVGEICSAPNGGLIMNDAASHQAAEMFRSLRSNLIFSHKDAHIILVTSVVEGEGKTFVAANLAASLAQTGKRVLLLGLDMRRPALAKTLNLKTSPGIANHLADGQPLDSMIQSVGGYRGLDVIVAGQEMSNPSELLLSDRLDAAVEHLGSKYDYIILDSAPISHVSDTYSLDRLCDVTLFVCRANHTRIKDLGLIDEIAENGRLKNIEVVVNGTTPTSKYVYGSSYSK